MYSVMNFKRMMPNEKHSSRNSQRRCSVRGVLKNFAKLTEKYLCQRFFFNKVARLLLFFRKMTLIFTLTTTCKLKVNALKNTSEKVHIHILILWTHSFLNWFDIWKCAFKITKTLYLNFPIILTNMLSLDSAIYFKTKTILLPAWCKSGTRIPEPGIPSKFKSGTRDPLKFRNGTPGPPSEFKNGTPGHPTKFKSGTPSPPFNEFIFFRIFLRFFYLFIFVSFLNKI